MWALSFELLKLGYLQRVVRSFAEIPDSSPSPRTSEHQCNRSPMCRVIPVQLLAMFESTGRLRKMQRLTALISGNSAGDLDYGYQIEFFQNLAGQ